MLSKVPEVTIFFWIIKILATTIGETAADYLADNLGLGLTTTTYVMSAALAVAFVFQFRARQYVPVIYWVAVVFLSVVGTLITDNLVENYDVTLRTTTVLFSLALAVTFAVWYREREDALDPLDLHHEARGVLLARDPLHLRAGHRGR